MNGSDPRSRPIIEVKDLRKEYPIGDETVVALKRINLNVMRGEICCIFGTSGSGKSTLLNQLAGMEKPTRGQVSIGGVPISRLSENQLASFRPAASGLCVPVLQPAAQPDRHGKRGHAPHVPGRAPEQREAAARKILCQVGLSHRLDHFPRQMSGGQQQRAGIARAFIARPDVVFADEPTGNLDSKTTVEIMDMICTFARDYHQTIILVTHDPEMASYADRIVTLIDGEIVPNQVNNKESTHP